MILLVYSVHGSLGEARSDVVRPCTEISGCGISGCSIKLPVSVHSYQHLSGHIRDHGQRHVTLCVAPMENIVRLWTGGPARLILALPGIWISCKRKGKIS